MGTLNPTYKFFLFRPKSLALILALFSAPIAWASGLDLSVLTDHFTYPQGQAPGPLIEKTCLESRLKFQYYDLLVKRTKEKISARKEEIPELGAVADALIKALDNSVFICTLPRPVLLQNYTATAAHFTQAKPAYFQVGPRDKLDGFKKLGLSFSPEGLVRAIGERSFHLFYLSDGFLGLVQENQARALIHELLHAIKLDSKSNYRHNHLFHGHRFPCSRNYKLRDRVYLLDHIFDQRSQVIDWMEGCGGADQTCVPALTAQSKHGSEGLRYSQAQAKKICGLLE